MPASALLLATALAASRPAPELLRLKPVVGRHLEFGLRFAMEFEEADGKSAGGLSAAFLIAERVIAVRGGRIELRRNLRAQSVEGQGEAGERLADDYRTLMDGTYPVATDFRARVLPLAAPVELGPHDPLPEPPCSSDVPANPGSSVSTIDVTLPERPVSPGESWTGTYAGQVELRYTLRGIAPIGDRRVALIALDQPTPSPGGYALEPDGLFALDLADGRWLRARAGFALKAGGRTLAVRYAIARTGAPEWPAILAAFPEGD